MNTGRGVFVLRDETALVAMQAASFATEDDFRRLLAAFPQAGEHPERSSPKWKPIRQKESAATKI